MTLTHYQPTDPGYSFGANFCYRLIRESLIFATFSAVGMGVGLYAGAGWLIREYIRYIIQHNLPTLLALLTVGCLFRCHTYDVEVECCGRVSTARRYFTKSVLWHA